MRSIEPSNEAVCPVGQQTKAREMPENIRVAFDGDVLLMINKSERDLTFMLKPRHKKMGRGLHQFQI
ncbi:hypothetical protein RRG08_033223 [Elysia crispata]|uniref:Uncharacterized protein n=1 Tax=Elysia crispata TaxID=231223 RepID=A0AAE1BAQ3_9GAST|nr:hypothetical protein RRG08_033223 [Elysia crispata]